MFSQRGYRQAGKHRPGIACHTGCCFWKDAKTGDARESNIYWIKYYRNGKPYRDSTKSIKESDAKRLLKKREGEISQGKLPGIYFDKVRFDELAEDYIRDYRINNRKSSDRAIQAVAHLKKAFQDVRVPDITTPRIEAYMEKRMEGKCKGCGKAISDRTECPFCGSNDIEVGAANATINRELSALRRVLNIGA